MKYNEFKKAFIKRYSKFREYLDTEEFKAIYNSLYKNKEKMIWAIEDLDSPPLEGIGKRLMQLPVDFKDPNIRKMTGAMICTILSDEYEPISSGHRVRWKPFITSSKYRKIKLH